MAYTHRSYNNKYQIEYIISTPKVLGVDFSEFVKRATELKKNKSLINKMLESSKLKKDYFNKVTDLYTNKIEEINTIEGSNKIDVLLSDYKKLCKVFNKDIFAYERLANRANSSIGNYSQDNSLNI